MHVVVLVKGVPALHSTIDRFAAGAAARGHDVRLLDKKAFLAGDLRGVDVVCLKSHVDDDGVWQMIHAADVRAVNPRMICRDRAQLDRLLRDAGLPTPRSARCADEVARLPCPIVQKANSLRGASDLRTWMRPPEAVDTERHFYQQLMPGDGATCKVYCIGRRAFLVKEFNAEPSLPGRKGGRRQQFAIAQPLAELARQVGAVLKLEVYGVDFVGRADRMFVVDVNPFPSFQSVAGAADALWDFLEGRCE